MIRVVALTDAKYDWSHEVNFSQIINGCTPERAEAAGIKFIAPAAGQLCEDAQVAALWTPDPKRSRGLAQALNIPDVLQSAGLGSGTGRCSNLKRRHHCC